MNLIQKISRIMMAMLLLVSTNGFTLSKHYCMGKLQSLSVEVSDHEDSPCNEMEMKMDCCQDEHTQLKVDEAKGDLSGFDFSIQFIAPLFKVSTPPELILSGVQIEQVFYPDVPPLEYSPTLYIVNQVFRL